MNYQPLFELMTQHGLTLTESEMHDITYSVKKCLSLTKEHINRVKCNYSHYEMERKGFEDGINFILKQL